MDSVSIVIIQRNDIAFHLNGFENLFGYLAA